LLEFLFLQGEAAFGEVREADALQHAEQAADVVVTSPRNHVNPPSITWIFKVGAIVRFCRFKKSRPRKN
jgi:hypothetical protein